jgi:hypothetical protein
MENELEKVINFINTVDLPVKSKVDMLLCAIQGKMSLSEEFRYSIPMEIPDNEREKLESEFFMKYISEIFANLINIKKSSYIIPKAMIAMKDQTFVDQVLQRMFMYSNCMNPKLCKCILCIGLDAKIANKLYDNGFTTAETVRDLLMSNPLIIASINGIGKLRYKELVTKINSMYETHISTKYPLN